MPSGVEALIGSSGKRAHLHVSGRPLHPSRIFLILIVLLFFWQMFYSAPGRIAFAFQLVTVWPAVCKTLSKKVELKNKVMEPVELARKAVNSITNGKNNHSEGKVAKAIEQQTAKLPSDLFLWAGLGCVGLSALIRLVGLRSFGQFIGQLGAPILIMGLYNKLVKTHGSDKTSTSKG